MEKYVNASDKITKKVASYDFSKKKQVCQSDSADLRLKKMFDK